MGTPRDVREDLSAGRLYANATPTINSYASISDTPTPRQELFLFHRCGPAWRRLTPARLYFIGHIVRQNQGFLTGIELKPLLEHLR